LGKRREMPSDDRGVGGALDLDLDFQKEGGKAASGAGARQFSVPQSL